MKKWMCGFVFVMLLSTVCCAQYRPNEASIGLRLGGTSGLSFKKRFNTSFGIEVVAGNNFEKPDDGLTSTLLFQKHAPLLGPKFSALAGAGPSYDFARKSAGVAAMLGFDWRLLNSPINIQADWMPGYYFKGSESFRLSNGAVTLRYVLNWRQREEQ